MRRELIATVALFVAMALVVAPPACAQSLPTLDEASALLKKAIDTTNLKAPGGPPFHLIAKIHYALDDKTADGKYEILYAAPDRYRVQLQLDGVGETDVALGDKLYVARETPTLTYPFWSIREFLWEPGWPFLGADPKATRVYTSKAGTEVRPCLQAEGEEAVSKQVCFDAATHAVVSIHVAGNPLMADPETVRFENNLDDFIDLGPIRYPRHLLKRFFSETIEATVERLDSVDKFSDDAFSVPPNAHVRDWCASPVLENEAKFPAPRHPTDPWLRTKDFIAFYLLVRKDGYVKNILMLHSSGNARTDRVFATVTKNGRYVTDLCGGKAIEYETVALREAPGRP